MAAKTKQNTNENMGGGLKQRRRKEHANELKEKKHDEYTTSSNTYYQTDRMTTNTFTEKYQEDRPDSLDNKSTTTKKGSHIFTSVGTYWLTRIVMLRYLAFIYFVAFLVALHQNKQLIGKEGLLPANDFLNKVKSQSGGITLQTITSVPSIVWLFDYDKHLNDILDYTAYGGLGLSMFVFIWGGANWFIMLTLWALYHSLVNIGQRWYGFGWESQLLETGFLATFFCPLLSVSALPKRTPTSKVVLWGNRWLIFRIMLGAGLIKIRGDQCWRDLTCMNFHYETQPVPNPMSYYMHQSPEAWHKFETLSNHFVELVAPVLLLLPLRLPAMIGGAIQVFFQVVLIISGNLSFLNWLTILPSLACFDDKSYAWMFTASTKQKVAQIEKDYDTQRIKLKSGNYIRRVWNVMLAVMIGYLSIPVVQNLLSSRQHMNTSFEPLRLVNTYGAFGSVTKARSEVVYEGTHAVEPDSPLARWYEYEFKCKPGHIMKRPCVISPYHYRLDWLLWFAAFQSYEYNPWMLSLAGRLLINHNDTMSLIEHNPFKKDDPPRYIRALHYRYRYTKIGSKEAAEGKWWKRTYIKQYFPPVSLRSLRSININIPG